MAILVGRRPDAVHAPLLAVAALAGGALVALLPLRYSLALFAGGLLVALSIWEPALGLGGAIVLGPTRAYLAASGYYGPLYDFGQIFFALAAAGWLARGAFRREVTFPRLGLFLLLGAWIMVGLLSLFGTSEWRDGLNESIKWIEVAVTLVIALSEAQRGRLGWIIAAILLSGLLQAGLGLWQSGWRGVGPESFQLSAGLYRAYGTFEQPNPFGGFLGLIWPVAAGLGLGQLTALWHQRRSGLGIRQWLRRLLSAGLCLATAGFLLLGLYASFSRGAWLGAASAAVVLLIFLPRRLRVGLGLVGLALAGGGWMVTTGLLPASVAARLANVVDFVTVADVRGININDANFALVERLAHWQAAEAMAQAHPWLGVGLGSYVAAYPQYSLINWPISLGHAHNIYLHTLAETGWLGLTAYVSLWVAVIILNIRAVRRAVGLRRGLALGLLGVWAHLTMHHLVDNLHVNNNDLLLAAYLGILYALYPPRHDPLG